jgi:two-component system LytT family response regulator
MAKVLIVDDEESGGNVLRLLIQKYFPSLSLIGVCNNIVDAEIIIKKDQPDIVLLDIKMPGGGGFELLAKFKEINFAVIFITAHEEFALKALKISAVDYLLKPINKTDLDSAIIKSLEFLKLRKFYKENIKTTLINHYSNSNEKVFVINKYKGEEISFKEIIYIKADSNYATIYGVSKTYTVSKTLKEIEELICDDSNQMIRIHKSYIINTTFLENVSKNSAKNIITLKNGLHLEVSKRRWLLLKEMFRKTFNA